MTSHLIKFVLFDDAVTKPQCTANLTEHGVVDEFQVIDVQCTVTYYGKSIPTFYCLPETQTTSSSHSIGDKSAPFERVATYSHAVEVTRPLHNTQLTCKMTYSPEDSMANVTPHTSNFVWTTVPLFVTCEY